MAKNADEKSKTTEPSDSAAAGAESRAWKWRPAKVRAEQCPANANHRARVYKTEGRTRYCACDDCGATWKQSGDYADPLRQFADDLATSLEEAEAVVIEEGRPPVILLERDEARETVRRLRELVAGD